jgi:hypothetical protein
MTKRPFTAVPATRSSARALRRKQRTIIGALLLGFLCGPLALFVAGRLDTTPPTIPPALPTQAISFAELVAGDFLDAKPTSLPAATGVDRTFGFNAASKPLEYTSLIFDRAPVATVGAQPVAQVQFRLITAPTAEDGLPGAYMLTVPVLRDANGRTVLAAQPSLAPAVFAANSAVPGPRPEGALDTISPEVKEQIAKWAEAYASADGPKLKDIINKESGAPTGEYRGLGGFTCQQPCATPQWGVASDTPGAVWIRTTLVLTQDGANGWKASMEFDLLVADYSDDNLRRVVAWGPVGSGPTLTPYQNILTT